MENLSSIFEFWKDLTPSQAAFLENSARSETFTPGMLMLSRGMSAFFRLLALWILWFLMW